MSMKHILQERNIYAGFLILFTDKVRKNLQIKYFDIPIYIYNLYLETLKKFEEVYGANL